MQHNHARRMSRLILTCGVLGLLSAPQVLAEVQPMKQSAEVEAKINALIESMTVEEMAGQLTQIWGSEVQDTNPVTAKTKHEDLLGQIRAGMVGSLLGAHGAEYINELQRAAVKESKHGIPLIIGNDVIHGYRTMFPIPLGGAATWDVDLIEKSERVAAIECAAMGTHWTFAPMIDVCRDPRWGRVAEGAGEDPMLGSAMAAARVRGFQGKDLTAKDTVLACAKHFVAYGGAEGGRDYNTVDISLQTLHDVYLPPFKAAVNVGAGSIMSAFNEVNGVPASANPYTLTTVLRDQWGFGGFVVSDWSSVTEVIPHGFAVDAADADAKAITAGVDMDMSSMSYREHLPSLVKSGKVSKAVVEEAVRRVLRMKFALGLFDDPYLDTELEKKVILTDENRALAREVARSSFVLLRNEDSLLPIKDDVKSIAVVGPLAESKRDPLGTWAGVAKAEDVVSVMEGLKSRAGEKVSVRYAKGCDISSDDTSGFSEAVELTKDSDLVVIVIGESAEMSGEAHSRSSVELPGVQRELVQAVAKTGKPVVVVLLNGRPMALPWIAENIPAILVTWHAGIECGNAVADVLFGDFNPCGKLPSTFPRKTGQIPIYLGHKNTGRPPTTERYTSKYIDLPWTPLYPFGYGLSYTTFGYSNLNIASSDIKRDGTLSVTVDVANTGKVAGAEIVQLYVRDLVGSMTRPVKELKAFRKVTLAPGESQNIAFDVAASELGFHNWDMEYVVEPGEFQLWVGGSSTGDVEGRFQIVE